MSTGFAFGLVGRMTTIPGQVVRYYNSCGGAYNPLTADRLPVTVASSSHLMPATVRLPLGPIAMRVDEDHRELLIDPHYMDGIAPFYMKQFHYYMDGIYTANSVQPAEKTISDSHGQWTCCRCIQGSVHVCNGTSITLGKVAWQHIIQYIYKQSSPVVEFGCGVCTNSNAVLYIYIIQYLIFWYIRHHYSIF